MIEKVEKFCLENDLFSAHDRLVVACSGGPDSMALVDILRRLQHKHDLQLYIAHAEHGIRQESSLEDARYVQNYCRKYNLPFYLEHLNVPDFARERKMSTETAARVLRYCFLRKVKDATGSAKIATAHHLNDQAETFLQHLIRGAGSAGLSGMRAVNGEIVRPFLCLYRREIEAYCEKYDLQPRLDETNLSLEYERNKIRLELLPLLEKYNSGIVKSICNSAKIIAEQNDYINFSAQKVYNNICKQSADRKVHLDVLQVKQEHIALRTALYRLIIRNVQGNLENITAKDVFDAAKQGDAVALAQVENFGKTLGKALAAIACVTDPEVFVIGGGVVKAGPILIDVIRKYYRQYAFHASREVEFKAATLGNNAGIYGGVKMVLPPQ